MLREQFKSLPIMQMRTIPLLTAANCTLVVLHSMNVRLFLDRLKNDREGRNMRVRTPWVVFVSARVDKPGPLKWVSDPGILRGYMYVLAYVLGFNPGDVDYDLYWMLEVYLLQTPVQCAAVGMGLQRPRKEHASAMRLLNAQCAFMQIDMSSRVWTFGDEVPTPFTNCLRTKQIPLSMIQCYKLAMHHVLGRFALGDSVWYTFTTRDAAGPWIIPEGCTRVQVKVLGHCYVAQLPVRTVRVGSLCAAAYILVSSQDLTFTNASARMKTIIKTLGAVRAHTRALARSLVRTTPSVLMYDVG